MAPVVVFRVRPAGSDGLIAKLTIAPPVDVIVGPLNTDPTTALPDDVDKVKAGFATLTVSEYVAGDVPEELVAVIV